MTSTTFAARDGETVLIDELDLERIGSAGWFLHRSGSMSYLVRWKSDGSRTFERLHRLVIGAEQAELVDHINGDTLDNRRSNLRIVDHEQSRANQGARRRSGDRSRHRGVSWAPDKGPAGRWRAQINVRGSRTHLGYFDDEDEAARAWNDAASDAWGEFARLNEV